MFVKRDIGSSGEKEGEEDFIIDAKDLEFTDRLGTGASAMVFKGKYKGKEVAIKILKETFDPSNMEDKAVRDYKHECSIMSKARSPYIIHYYGSCLQPQVSVVVEYCMRGSLYDAMQDEFLDIAWDRVFKWARELTTAIQMLHTFDPPIYHRDLKSPNILLNNDWTAKVCDFGASRVAAGDAVTLTKMRGTFAYCAPELYFGTPFTTKSDVYSISVILWELVVRCLLGKYQRPYSEFPGIQLGYAIIIKTAKNGLRPTVPENMPPQFRELIQKAWDAEPANRPECSAILEQLSVIEKYYLEHKSEWDALHTPPPKGKERPAPLLRTESVRIPLTTEDLAYLKGFTNVHTN